MEDIFIYYLALGTLIFTLKRPFKDEISKSLSFLLCIANVFIFWTFSAILFSNAFYNLFQDNNILNDLFLIDGIYLMTFFLYYKFFNEYEI